MIVKPHISPLIAELRSRPPGCYVDIYLALFKQIPRGELEAIGHFAQITRAVYRSILSPSFELLNRAKAEAWPFPKYKEALLMEFGHNKGAVEGRLAYYRNIMQKERLFLLCYEKDPNECHRSIVKDLLEYKLFLPGSPGEDLHRRQLTLPGVIKKEAP